MIKGQSVPQELKDKTNASKHKRALSLMKWEICDPYLDIVLENGSSGKEKKYITFRQFKENMISGISSKQMEKDGISKHVLQFYCNFCKGKITLDKETFEKEYQSGKELVDIAKKYNVTRENITYLRQLYNIKRTGATYQNRIATEVKPTQRQIELIYGSLMGDAKKVSHNAVGFGQGGTQEEYCFWKFIETASIISKPSFREYKSYDERSGNTSTSWRCYTTANSHLEPIIYEFYNTGVKEVTQKILDNLSDFSVAVWFMDDGRTDWFHRDLIEHPHWNITPMCIFCTDSFSYESCLLIQKWFLEKFNIKVRLKERQLKDRIGYRVVVDNEDTNKFIDLIKPHIIPSMLYKVDYDEYIKWRNK